jgi:TIR domain
MRVFISWSGERSGKLAEAIRSWLPGALQYVKPYFTPSDIEKGTRWATEISRELAVSKVCIIVLTRENLQSTWMAFEAGAISTALDRTRICPLLFGLEPTDVQGPLALFQATLFTKLDVRQLFKTINAAAEENKLSDHVVEAVFEKWWPDLDAEVRGIMQTASAERPEGLRSELDLLQEVLQLVRNMQAVPATLSSIEAAIRLRMAPGTMDTVLPPRPSPVAGWHPSEGMGMGTSPSGPLTLRSDETKG